MRTTVSSRRTAGARPGSPPTSPRAPARRRGRCELRKRTSCAGVDDRMGRRLLGGFITGLLRGWAPEDAAWVS